MTAVTILLVCIIAALILMSIWREIMWREERRELCNRIMAGGLRDYADNIKEKPPPTIRNTVLRGIKLAEEGRKPLGGDED